MRVWLRFVLTLALGPAVWWVGKGYVATQQGATAMQWWGDSVQVLPAIFLFYTLPALLLCAILLAVERALRLLSMDLFTVLVSPVIGYGLAWLAVRFIPEQHVQAAGAALPLLACYGLVWGLTIREPASHRRGDFTRHLAA